MKATRRLGKRVGVADACRALSVPRASYYRWRGPERPPRRVCKPARSLSEQEENEVLSELNSGRFMDCAPAQVYAELLGEERYLCSIRTMYRILHRHRQVRERRNQRCHPRYRKPELLATAPNQVWSWDITKLLGPQKWTYFYLYVLMDIFSRYVVGWLVATLESAALAKQLMDETIQRQSPDPASLTIHSDRGPSMTSKTVAQFLADLGVTKTHSRPYVSNDNPYSEAGFKTLKYRPSFPGRFGSLPDARGHLAPFFAWYNDHHHHSGIGLMTPHQVHFGAAQAIHKQRAEVLNLAYERHPERFVCHRPLPPRLPEAVWINPPHSQEDTAISLH